ncbi:group II intron reverse transcriptase/maturase [Bradyrhizobium sp. GM24.11]
MNQPSKPFNIDKRKVYEAYLQVRSNGGAAGVDGVTIEEFESDLKSNLYKIWNRMSSGAYFPPPVRAVSIPKKSGGQRILGVPTVADRVAQTVAKQLIEPTLDAIFLADSYGYRPGKSALDAVGVTRKRCWKYDWVLEFDIKGLFDNIDHELLLRAVRKHVKCEWALLYIERWLTAPIVQEDGAVVERSCGTPQGGVVSPILANLFMHYTFDLWTARTFPELKWCRYADDGLIHCQSEVEAQSVCEALKIRLAECRLELHPTKTRIVYCKDDRRRGRARRLCSTFSDIASGRGQSFFPPSPPSLLPPPFFPPLPPPPPGAVLAENFLRVHSGGQQVSAERDAGNDPRLELS